MIRCVVGLGNPGAEYESTRHNIGFRAVNLLTKQAGARWQKRWWKNYWIAIIEEPAQFLCAKPATFMNLSGKAVYKIVKKYEIPAEELLIVYDDVHLPLGKLRVRAGGSSGGHNGLQSIINYLETEKIPRLRLGIGEGKGDRIMHVLSNFDENEKNAVQKMIAESVDAIKRLKTTPLEKAAQQINKK